MLPRAEDFEKAYLSKEKGKEKPEQLFYVLIFNKNWDHSLFPVCETFIKLMRVVVIANKEAWSWATFEHPPSLHVMLR